MTMLRIHTGHDTRYLTDAVAAGREGYYTDAVVAGEPPGLWYGAGAATLGLVGEVDAELLEALYTERLDPRDGAAHSRSTWGDAARLGKPARKYQTPDQLYAGLLEKNPGAGPERRDQLRAQAERCAHQPVSFYDMTFSPSKTVTTLWAGCAQAAEEARAAGDADGAWFWSWAAGQVEAAVLDGARAGVDYAQDVACYARTGHHGGGAGTWAKGQGLVVAGFLQHDTRNGDPQLHVHQAIDNVVECPDGGWRAVDGALLHQARGAIGAISERRTDAGLFRRLGVAVATRPDGKAREVLGASTALAEEFSSRRHDITSHAEAAAARFRAAYGREPNSRERDRIGEQAFLATRPPKSPVHHRPDRDRHGEGGP